jgi:hypothetical protein
MIMRRTGDTYLRLLHIVEATARHNCSALPLRKDICEVAARNAGGDNPAPYRRG